MPIKRLDRGLCLTVLCCMAVGANPSAHSQTPPQTGAPTRQIQPTLNVQATATSNSELARGGTVNWFMWGGADTINASNTTGGVTVLGNGGNDFFTGGSGGDSVTIGARCRPGWRNW